MGSYKEVFEFDAVGDLYDRHCPRFFQIPVTSYATSNIDSVSYLDNSRLKTEFTPLPSRLVLPTDPA